MSNLTRMTKVPMAGKPRERWMDASCCVCHRKYWSPGRVVQVETISGEYAPSRRYKVTHETCLPDVVDAKVEAIIATYMETGSVFV